MRIFTVPNLITSMNLLCGILGVICALNGAQDMALLLMILAAVFDFLDGLAARVLHSVSPIGKELDSLSDMVSFGVLPSLMMVEAISQGEVGSIVAYLPLFLALMSAFRLAKFNIDERQTTDFLGLPTPAAALFTAALVNCNCSVLHHLAATAWFYPVTALVLGLLLVSEIPMFSMKVAKGHKLLDTKRIVFLSLSVAALVYALAFRQDWVLALLLVFGIYILENLILVGIPAKKEAR